MTFHCQFDGGELVGIFANPQAFPTILLADDDPRIVSARAYPNGLPLAIKMECQRRIYAVVDRVAQVNLAAAAAGGVLTTEQMAIYRSGLAWIAAMRASCGTLIANSDQTFADDSHWPAPAAAIIALADAF